MQRVKNIQYDDDDVYDEEEDYADEGEGVVGETYSAEDRENFATLTPVVRAELEEAGLQASDREIEESLWHYYWDVGKSATYLKNNKAPKPQQPQAKKQDEKPKSKFDQAAEISATKAGNMKSKQAANGLAKKTEQLRLDQTDQPTQPKVRSKGLDVPKLWAEEESRRKKSAAFVVIGHVDHGKSTLMGRLLLDTGAVSQRDVDKYQKQAAELGKVSFALAWVMDTGTEERERGVTVDIAQHHFSTENMDFTILDAPGHRDFVPNMIGGATMADLAVLVVDAGQLESGMKGQTREHILLAKAVGLQKIVVAVNKLDSTTPAWSEDVFEHTQREVTKFLKHTGFQEKDVIVVPCSGLSGENVVKAPRPDSTTSWIQAKLHPTLLQALGRSKPQDSSPESIKGLLRMQMTDVFRGGIINPLSVAGRITSGNVQVGDVALVQPSGESATVKGIEVSDEARDFAVAGQICTLHLADIEAQHLRIGDLLCTPQRPVPVVNSFVAVVEALDSLLPQSIDLHIGRLHVPASVSRLISIHAPDGEVRKRKPRMIKSGQRASIKLVVDNVPIDTGERVVLRTGGVTLAYGTVE